MNRKNFKPGDIVYCYVTLDTDSSFILLGKVKLIDRELYLPKIWAIKFQNVFIMNRIKDLFLNSHEIYLFKYDDIKYKVIRDAFEYWKIKT